MIKEGVIIDTSVLIDFLNGSEKYSDQVIGLLEKNRAVITGIIIAELLQGIKNTEEEQTALELMSAIETLEISTGIWIKAGRISSSLRKKGINLPLTDIAIAALALEYNLHILTIDKHFGQIPGIRLLNP
ncbi:PIN domain-containing protein [bacterium]|nr:PIN domain-containing protein [bacterium]